uniref:RNMT-activating mini protein n=1 Tax=Gouania willdenowi TaxID=441366 RepID=A0A8C5HS51_GOUWI
MTESKENTQSYEEMFAKRFTAEDEEYQKYVNRPTDPPPIVENWRGRGGGNHRGWDTLHYPTSITDMHCTFSWPLIETKMHYNVQIFIQYRQPPVLFVRGR